MDIKKLDSATDKVRELQSDFDSLKNYSNGSYGFDSNFSSLLMSVANFLADVDTVYEAMDEAFDEIERLRDENSDLLERVEELEKIVDEYAEVG